MEIKRHLSLSMEKGQLNHAKYAEKHMVFEGGHGERHGSFIQQWWKRSN
jgi:hypothetical protein